MPGPGFIKRQKELKRQEKQEEKAQRKAERRQKAMDALGLDTRREKQVTQARQDAARRTTADPTMRDHEESRRDPRL